MVYGRKKAALDVSINSIVVIVFAVTMLGLGLAFIKGYFAKATNIIDLDQGAPIPPATPEKPISLSSETLKVEKAKTGTFKANFYNNKQQQYSVSFDINGCIDEETGNHANIVGTDTVTPYFKLTSSPQAVNVGEQKEFVLKLHVEPVTPSKGYICSVRAIPSPGDGTTVLEDKQVTVSVK